ncbi:alpha/beta fold hydrolase [Zavarzinia compransoris]|uniref:Epoxide hydrolase n=1 Tax=Zavarzinia compransoris TaxID=1264899 RepID=A0A317DUA9_9PROT|nr:alpha/beta fold hydrolase [Zavarzinia compransoris]PWR17570.1 epoxide hydrolase [Zavarzinia compransoris]TDP49228.1 alpha-beta hydrolase superfamily lysophospholipase [Zavarzinia compransoris]
METIRVAANGLDFEVDQAGSGDKFALLLHGFPESKFSWRAQIPVFAERGYTVWAPNLRGYGNTTRPAGRSNYTLDHLTEDVAGLIDAARARGIKGPVTLVAHDWGGAIAWAFVLRGLRPLERFVILNMPHPVPFFKALKTFAQLRRSWYMFFFQLPWLPELFLGARGAKAVGDAFRGMAVDKSRFPDEVLAEYRKNALKPGALTAMLNYYRANIRIGGAKLPPAPVVEVPTLMIWGEADTALGKETTYGTDKLVKDLTLRYLPAVSHWVQQEAPETVNAMIAAWLDGKTVPEARDIVHTGEAARPATA